MHSKSIEAALFCSTAIAFGLMAPAHAARLDEAAAMAVENTGEITGVVMDTARGGFLVGAEVRINGLDVVAVTNSEGRYVLRRVPAGRHELTVSYFGRAPVVVSGE
ncbi:hypothetical protein LTR94_028039, partial [Friedmanniomyces endolithicus]